MNVLITAGGTKEQIDSVRSITNHGTGRLGSKIADAFAQVEKISHIAYVCGPNAVLPETEKAQICPIRGTRDLEAVIRRLTGERHYDAIIHSMAVSDYRVKTVTTVSEISEAVKGKENPAAVISDMEGFDQNGKLSSSIPDLAVLLERTPKIIGMLRQLAPDAVLVGFKLLDHVPHRELMEVAEKLLHTNDCDFVLANDMETVNSPCHVGFLLDRAGNTVQCNGKDAIAAEIVKAVMNGKAGTK